MIAAIIVPHDDMLVSMALHVAAQRGLVLQTDGRHSVMTDRLLPGYARITGGGTLRPAPEPEAA